MASPVSPNSTFIIIDPNGDTILYLWYPRYEFPAFQIPSSPKEAAPTVLSKGKGKAVADSDDPEDASNPDDDDEFQYLVSSAQLWTASRYFESMFRHGFSEAQAQSDGKYHINAQDFHLEALRHVLNIVHNQSITVLHNQSIRVPREPNLNLMATIAVIADYYDLKKDFLSTWAADVRAGLTKLPRTYNQLFVRWLVVSCYFGMEDTFYDLARQAILVCPNFTQTYNLPTELPRINSIRDKLSVVSVLDKLFVHRLKHSEILSDAIERVIKRLRVYSVDWDSEDAALKYDELVRQYLATLRTQVGRFAQKDGGSFLDIKKCIKAAGKQFQKDIPEGNRGRYFYARVRSTKKYGPLLDHDLVYMGGEMLWFASVDFGFVLEKPEEHEEDEVLD